MGVTLKRNGDVEYYGQVIGRWNKREPRKEARERGDHPCRYVKVLYEAIFGMVAGTCLAHTKKELRLYIGNIFKEL